MSSRVSIKLGVLSLFAVLALTACSGNRTFEPYKRPESGILLTGADEKNLLTQSRGRAAELDRNCMECHKGHRDPHRTHEFGLAGADGPPAASAETQYGYGYYIACVDCHGGAPEGETKEQAHPRNVKYPALWASSANPERSYTLLLAEEWEWIRFVNPGDLRVANTTCGPCHPNHVLSVTKSLMTTSAHFWGTAGYANGIIPLKKTFLGESYNGAHGLPQRLNTVWKTEEEKAADLAHDVVPSVLPLPH